MFSGIVKIADIDDYITPSQKCIKPISNEVGKVKFDINNYKLEKPDLIKNKNNKAKVSLTDCLACSGCVTTAETLLIQAQSVDEFIKNIKTDKISIVCVSPQSIMSLANYYKMNKKETLKIFCNVLQEAGVNYVFNFNSAVSLTLHESYEEWKRRDKFILCSECPGWICYAEKKAGESIIPYLSKVKSPQQILGHVLKSYFSQISEKEVYLSCIMPCYDKKLEASRDSNREGKNLEVDTVISTNEIIELFEKLNIDFRNKKYNTILQNIYFSFEKLLNNQDMTEEDYNLFFASKYNFSSNAYSEYIINRYIYDNNIVNYKLERKNLRNVDMREINLIVEDKKILSFSLIYGFRNIQNILRNKNKINYSYIEIMACPGGCLNGGGQMKSLNSNENSRDILNAIENDMSDLSFDDLFEKEIVILKNFLKDNIFTNYKAIENSNINLKW